MGARNSASDMARIQAAHDLLCELGATCKANEEAGETPQAEAFEGESENVKAFSLAYVKSLRIDGDDDRLRELTAVKSLGGDDIHGYLALYGDAKRVDLESEYFTTETDFWMKRIGLPLPLTWDHAQDKAMKSDPVIGQITELGSDELGVWYNAQLSQAHRYRRYVDGLIKSKSVGTSSDSVPQYVERVATGKSVWLKRWPLVGGALTTTPCEPRMISEGSPHYKAIADALSTRTSGLDSLGALLRWHDVIRLV